MLQRPNKYRIIFALLLLLVVSGVTLVACYQDQALDYAKHSLTILNAWHAEKPFLFILGYSLAYLFCQLIFIPADTVFMMLAGAVLSFPVAVGLACSVHTIGTFSTFYISRYLVVHERSDAHKAGLMETATNREKWNAWFTLLLLRMTPLIPTHAISLAIATRPITARGFFTATWLGTLPLTLFMAFVGREITHIQNLGEVVSPELFIGIAAALAGLMLGRVMFNRWLKSRV